MPVSSGYAPNSSTGNGVTTVFPYNFRILAAADLEVSVDGVVKTLTTDYSVSGVGAGGGGNVTFVVAPLNGTTVIRRRNMALVRTTDYQDNGDLLADVLNPDQDAPVLMVQQLQEQINRSVKAPLGDATSMTLPSATDRAGKVLVFDNSGNAGVAADHFADLAAAASASAGAAAGSAGAAAGSAAAAAGSAGASAQSANQAAAIVQGNFLQTGVSPVARTFTSKAREWVSAEDFGAVGDGITNDGPALQLFLNELVSSKRSGRLGPKVYLTNQELVITGALRLMGDNGQVTMLKAGVAMRSVVKVSISTHGEISGVMFHGNRLANYCMLQAGVSGTVFHQCVFTQALIDGVNSPASDPDTSVHDLNDRNTYDDCEFSGNGKLYASTAFASGAIDHYNFASRALSSFTFGSQIVSVAATVSMPSGSNVVTGTGTNFLTVQKVRPGDTIRIGTGASLEYFTVQQVDTDTQLLATRNAAVVHTAANFVLGVGAGFWEERSGDNNIHILRGGIFRFNASAGIVLNGLYGHLLEGMQFDLHANHSIVVGTSAGNPVITTQINKCYFEATGGRHFYLNAAQSIHIIAPLDNNLTDAENVEYANVGTVFGSYSNRDGVYAIGTAILSNMPQTVGAPAGKKFTNTGGFDHSSKLVAPGVATTYNTASPFPADKEIEFFSGSASTIQDIDRAGLSNRVLIVNLGATNLTIAHSAVLMTNGGVDIVLGQYDSAEFVRFASSYWLQIAPLSANAP